MNKLLIVHGYSDQSATFEGLAHFLRHQGIYRDIRYINYDSLDDQATFQDYADRLNDIYTSEYGNERIDILCHSTGSLVVRAWLALRRQRQLRRGTSLDMPVERLYLFAPANFGSDLATLGQSFWNRARRFLSMGNDSDQDGDSPWEVGKRILQGLEPASPEQWFLSQLDLHGGPQAGYFGVEPNPCFAFVFAAGRVEKFLGDRIISASVKPGTDATVRICGTSLNTRKYVFRPVNSDLDTAPLTLDVGNKAQRIPFTVFYDLNHTSIIGGRLNPGQLVGEDEYLHIDQSWSPLPLFKAAQTVTTLEQYAAVAQQFAAVDEQNYQNWQRDQAFAQDFSDAEDLQKYRDRYQQIFFRFGDDVDDEVSEVFIDFYVYDSGDQPHRTLTHELDEIIFQASEFYAHSVRKSHRVVLFNYDRWLQFRDQLDALNAKVILEIYAEPTSRSAYYERCRRVIYDPSWPAAHQEGQMFFYPNTTTLVEVVLNRRQREGLLKHQ